jgi:two-component system LytT family response regulator
MKIRTLIVDDEPWARTKLLSLLSSEADIEIVRACGGGEEAIEAIVSLAPALVFLDVQMPGMDGFAVIETIGTAAMPLVIFATAHNQYALRAFDAQALDYLLKPFDEERFQRALQRARQRLTAPALQEVKLQRLLESLRDEHRYLQKIVVPCAGRMLILKATDVDWLEASGNYVTLHVGRTTYLLRESLNAFEKKLDPRQFVRLHRSAMVNVDRIKELAPWSGGEQSVVLLDGTPLTVGRVFRGRLMAFMHNCVEPAIGAAGSPQTPGG